MVKKDKFLYLVVFASAGLVFAFWKTVVLGYRLYFLDLLHYIYPMYRFIRLEYLSGRFPLWNPYVTLGTPLAGQGDLSVFYPPILLFLCGEPSRFYPLMLFFHHLWGFIGMWWCLRQFGLSRYASLFGGVAFALSGILIANHPYPRLIYAAVWMPWVFGAFHCSLKEKSWKKSVMTGIFLSMQILSGGYEVTYLTVVLLVIYSIFYPSKEGSLSLLKQWSSSFYSLLTAGMVTLLLTAIQLFPLLVYLQNSSRSGGVGNQSGAWAFHPLRLFEFFVPELFGTVQPNPTFQTGLLLRPPELDPWHTTVYVGGFVIFLAIVGFSGIIRSRLVRTAVGILCISFIIATGDRYSWGVFSRHFFVGIDMFRFAEKFLIGVAFSLPIVAAYGLEIWMNLSVRRRLFWAVGATLFLVFTLLFAGTDWFVGIRLARNEQLVSIVAGFFAIAAAIWLGLYRKFQGHRIVPWLIIFLIVDLSSHAYNHLYSVSADEISVVPRAVRTILDHSDEGSMQRIWRFPGNREFEFPGTMSVNGPARAIYVYETLFQNSNVPHIQRISGFSPANSAVFDAFWEKYSGTPDTVLTMFGVRFIVARALNPNLDYGQYRVLTMDPDLEFSVFERQHYLPKAFMVGTVYAVPENDAVFSRMSTADFMKNDDVIVVDQELNSATTLIHHDYEERMCRVVTYTPQEVNIEVDSEQGGLLVLADAYYPEWKATLDGNPTRIYLTNGLLRGVLVPSGRHKITFCYSPPSFTIGLWVTLSAIILLVLVPGIQWSRRFKSR